MPSYFPIFKTVLLPLFERIFLPLLPAPPAPAPPSLETFLYLKDSDMINQRFLNMKINWFPINPNSNLYVYI